MTSVTRAFRGQFWPRAAWPLLLTCILGCRPSGCDGNLTGEKLEGQPESQTGPLQIEVQMGRRGQIIDGFGTTGDGRVAGERWYSDLFFDDLQASILRIDLTPRFRAPYSDHAYNSPWFHNAPALPGPDGNNVRTYHDVTDYSREWSGQRAQIAVFGPDVEQNIALLDFDEGLTHLGELAQRGQREKERLGDFKLIGSLWSPAPWLKRASGTEHGESSGIMPKNGTPFPFIWAGNFAGGVLDTSGTPIAAFDDSALGGTGPTSALTQFARGLSAFLLGFQRKFGVNFHAISIQNELGFEVFYNSCAYLHTADYVTALKVARQEFDRHPELRSVQIMGPEDLLGGDGYSLWQLGSGERAVPKNLQFMAKVAEDAEASKALAWFAIHGYGLDGVHAAGNQQSWKLWTAGWSSAPAAGLPERVTGARGYKKKSWMTETSGEPVRWAAENDAELGDSALGIATKIHSALTVGEQSAWLYWMLSTHEPAKTEMLTDEKLRANSPKYVAAKHYFRFIRPGAQRVEVAVKNGGGEILASAFAKDRGLVLVLINTGRNTEHAALAGIELGASTQIETFTSTADALFRSNASWQSTPPSLDLPPRSVTTLVATQP